LFFYIFSKSMVKLSALKYLYQYSILNKSHDSSVGTANGVRSGRSGLQGSIPGGDWEFFSLPPRPERFWAHPASYPMGTWGSFPGDKSGRGMKLTTHLYFVPKSRIRGAIPPLSQYVFMAWCLVKQRDNFTLTLP
jgi:hypothetical protein